MLLWIILAIAILLLLLVLASYLREKRNIENSKGIDLPSPKPIELEERVAPHSLFFPNRASEGSTSKYAVIDCQTTGLSIEEGVEDHIVEISWMILDQDYLEIERCTKRISQLTAGSYEAKKIHHISEIALENTGEDETEVMQLFWKATSGVPIWVFHNAHFDLSIIRASFRNHLPEVESLFLKKVAICTMSYLSVDKSREQKFFSLINLTEFLYDLSISPRSMPPIVSLRNVFLTRACLMSLLTEYQSLLRDNYPVTVEQHLVTRN